MYCPNCGAEFTPGLKYCKRCGGNLTETSQMSIPVAQPPRNTLAAVVLAMATVAIALGGLGIVFSHALWIVAPTPGSNPPIHDAVTIAGMMVAFGSATVAFIAFMLIKLFARVMSLPPAPDSRVRIKKPVAGDYQPAQLASPPAGISSVTEHTTRNFRPPVYDELKARE